MLGGPHDRVGGDLWGVDRRYGLGVVGQARADPAELRGVHRRQVDLRQPDVAVVGQQFAAQRVDEALQRVLGPAVGRLEWDAAPGKGRSDLHDGAGVAGHHAAQRSQRAVDRAEVGDLCHPFELIGRNILHPGEHRGHGVVDPDVDRAELLFDLRGRAVDLLGVGHIGAYRQRPSATGLDVAYGRVESRLATCEQSDAGTGPGEGDRGGAADAGAGACDDNYL